MSYKNLHIALEASRAITTTKNRIANLLKLLEANDVPEPTVFTFSPSALFVIGWPKFNLSIILKYNYSLTLDFDQECEWSSTESLVKIVKDATTNNLRLSTG